ncbi:MAG TPA: hypothetical protein EYH05_01700 [Anaerolineae bacterium]|nr:hypothetical protein [Anaerolineae bacterium]
MASEANEQRGQQDYIQQFIDECCVLDDSRDGRNSFVTVRELYAAYKGWCAGELTPMKNRAFSLSLKSKGIKFGKKYVTTRQMSVFSKTDKTKPNGKKQVRGYYGITLNDIGTDYLLISSKKR